MANNAKRKRRAPGEPTIYEKRRAGKQAAFLEALRMGASVAHAGGFAGISNSTQRNWRKTDSAFAADFAMAYDAGTGALAAEAIRRAAEGVERPIWHQGRPVIDPDTGLQTVVREYSDALLMFLLKSRAPETYCDRVRAVAIFRRWRRHDNENTSDTAPVSVIVDLLAKLAADKAATATLALPAPGNA